MSPAIEECTIAGLGPLMLPKVRCDRSQRPWWEAARLHSMHHYLGASDRVLDIGAEMGDLSALYASWGCDMFLVEPNPKAWPWIAATFAANNMQGDVHGCYVGMLGSQAQAHESSKTFMDYGKFITDGVWPDCVREEFDEATGFFHLAEHMEVSPVWTADALCNYTDFNPTAVTMDVEGGELNVLSGMKWILRACRPKVWISIHPAFMDNLYGHNPDQVKALMAEFDYDPVFLATDHEEHWMFLPAEMGWRY